MTLHWAISAEENCSKFFHFSTTHQYGTQRVSRREGPTSRITIQQKKDGLLRLVPPDKRKGGTEILAERKAPLNVGRGGRERGGDVGLLTNSPREGCGDGSSRESHKNPS